MTVPFALNVLCDPEGFFPEAVRVAARAVVAEHGTDEQKKMAGMERPYQTHAAPQRMSERNTQRLSNLP